MISEESFIISPKKASKTGLMREGWSVITDIRECRFSSEVLNIDSFVVRKRDNQLMEVGEVMRSARKNQLFGSLGFAQVVLELQSKGIEIIPAELQSAWYIILPRTILANPIGNRFVPTLKYQYDINAHRSQWCLDFYSLSFHLFYSER